MCRHVAGIEPGLPGWRGVIEGSPGKEEQVEAPGRGEPIPCEVWEAQRSGARSKRGKRGCKPRGGLSQAFLHPPGWLREPKVSTALLGLTGFGRPEESGVNALVSHLMAAKAQLGRRQEAVTSFPITEPAYEAQAGPTASWGLGTEHPKDRKWPGVEVSALWPQGTSPWVPESGR